jgi:Raf kinase inhibitor-like YbhB/YbcL family protein
MKQNIFVKVALLSIFLLTSCSGISKSQYDNTTAQLDAAKAQVQTLQNGLPAFMLTSSAFKTGEPMPVKYTQQGANVSPPLSWNSAPSGTQAFALLTEDIDGPASIPIIVHWVIFNIPATARSLPEGVAVADQLPDGTLQGSNIIGSHGYIGPSPPVGTTHRYEFTLFALDQKLTLNAGASRNETIAAMQGHILGVAQTMAAYKIP